MKVAPSMDHQPCVFAPSVSVFNKEVRSEACPHERTGWDLPVPLSVSTYGEIETGCLRHDIGVFLKLRIAPIHIAVLTALAFLMATMPQIPHLTHASCIWFLLSCMNYVSIPEECHQGLYLHLYQSNVLVTCYMACRCNYIVFSVLQFGLVGILVHGSALGSHINWVYVYSFFILFLALMTLVIK